MTSIPSKNLSEEDLLLEPLVAAVSEMVYERLEPAIAQRMRRKTLLLMSWIQQENFNHIVACFLLKRPHFLTITTVLSNTG